MKKRLKRKKFCNTFLFTLALPVFVYAFSSGPPLGVTGGFGEPNCTDCHLGTAVNAGGGIVSISAPGSYVSGTIYPITVTVSDPAQMRWGFELSSRTQQGQQAGVLMAGTDGFTQVRTSGSGIQYISHTTSGTRNGTPGGADFVFHWLAPEASAGPVVFNVAANAANGNFSNSGDHIYTAEQTVSPQTVPTINTGGIVNNASYTLASPNAAPGTIVAIFGSYLTDGSSCLPPECNPAFDSDNKLNTTLAGTQVTVNDTPVPIFYASPLQLGVEIPTELAGKTSATVRVAAAGQQSAPMTISLDPVSPGIFSFTADGMGAGAITHANGTPVSPQNPAQPGEVVILYATGLGEVTPPVPTGMLPSGLSTAVAPVTVNIDGIAVIPDFAGLSGCCVGLNQINVRVPATARLANDIPVLLDVAGKQSNTVTMAVGSGGS